MPCTGKMIFIILILMLSVFSSAPVFASEIILPRTGQTTSYASGDDGTLKSGLSWPEPRFTDNGNGTVSDILTGLLWLKDADCFGSQTWATAISTANGLANGLCALNDGSTAGQWRLPSVNELESLVDAERGTPALPAGHPFSGVQSLDYWSSSTYAGEVTSAWNVHMGSGKIGYYIKSDLLHIWPVRGAVSAPASVARTGQTAIYAAGDDGTLLSGVAWPTPRFTDNSNGTVTDSLTGLIWLKNTNCYGSQTWANALLSANNLASGSCNLSDSSPAGQWRLSNRKELLSLIDRSKYDLVLPAGHPFGAVQANGHWSSSTSSLATDNAWLVSLSSGTINDDVKTGSYSLWPVRGGQFGNSLIAVAPGTVDFEGVNVGGNSSQLITVSNSAASGSSSLHINAITLSGADPGQFSISHGDGSSGTCGGTPIITPGGSCSVTASFGPIIPGTKSAVLRISGSDATAANVAIPLAGVGLGFTVSGSVSGGNGTISSTNPVGVASGAAVSFTLAPDATYQPASAVTGSCLAGSWNMNTYTTGAITGDCTAGFSFEKIDAITASPSAYNFGDRPVGSGAITQTITLTSNRGGPLTITGIILVGAGAADYGITPGSCGSLTPTINAGSSCTINVGFTPISLQPSDASIMITSNDPVAPATTVTVSGKGVAELFDLGLIFSGYGSGSVALSTGTACTANCSNSYIGGTTVQLTPTPTAGGSSAFIGWTGCDSLNGNICTVILNGSKTVTAGFRSLLGVPSALVPQTGQNICYDASGTVRACADTGEDGDLVAGVRRPSVRFIASPDQTVIDSLTGLIWSSDAAPSMSSKTWLAALNYIKTLNSQNYLGHSDWRLPNVVELRSLINWQEANPANWLASQGFANLQAYEYWSSTSYPVSGMGGVERAWTVKMDDGFVWHPPTSYSYFVWPVRGGQTGSLGALSLIVTGQYQCYSSGFPTWYCTDTGEDGEYHMGAHWVSPDYIHNADQTVTDAMSGLVWSYDGNPGGTTKTWQGALDYIKSLNDSSYLGHRDWRLPNILELASMFYQPERYLGTAYNNFGFSNVNDANYWSATSYPGDATKAWFMDFADGGNLMNGNKDTSFNVWPVRGGLFEISVTPTVAAFPGTTAIFTSSTNQELIISNRGSVDQAVGTIRLSGTDADQFSLAPGTCPSLAPTVAAGTSCSVYVTFTPTTAGSKSAILQIYSGDPAALTSSVSLAGTAVIDPSPYGNVSINNGAVSASNASVSLNLSYSGSVTDMRFSNNNSSWSIWESYSTSKSWNLMAAGGDGQKTVYVQFRDGAGNVSSSFADTIILDTTPPIVTLTAKPAPMYNSTSGSVSFTANEPSTFTCSLDGGNAVSCTSPWTFTSLAEGSHTLAITATNTAGLTSGSVSHSWTIDTTPPETVFTGQPANPATSLPYTFSFIASEPGSTFECTLDGGTYAVCTTPYSLTNLSNGIHVLQVRAKDPIGNYDITAASYTWTVANPSVVMIGSSNFDSLAAALAASVNGDILRMQAAMPPSAVNFSGSGTRTLQGGYDTMFGSQAGTTNLQLLIVTSGTVIVDGVVIY